MNGKMRREMRRSGPPPSRSWTLAGCGSSTRPRPSVSTSACASVDLLAGIVAAWSASFCRLHALGIDDCTGRAGLTPRPLTIEHDQGVILLSGRDTTGAIIRHHVFGR